MSTTKTMVNVSPKLSTRTNSDRRELEKYLKMFSMKAVQAIVQSRLGEKSQTFSNPRSLSNDWVSSAILFSFIFCSTTTKTTKYALLLVMPCDALRTMHVMFMILFWWAKLMYLNLANKKLSKCATECRGCASMNVFGAVYVCLYAFQC